MSVENLFDVVFKGRFVKELDKNKAVLHFAKLFKLPADKAQRFFDGSPRVLKKNLALERANNFRQALKKAGLKVSLVKNANENYKAELTMSAVGVTLVAPVETPVVNIPTSQYSLDEVGAQFAQPQVIETATIDISSYTINNDETEIVQKDEVPQPEFDFTEMTLDEVGAIFDNPETINEPIFDLSNLTLDEVGSTIVEKKQVPEPEINTDSIQLID